MPKPAFHAHTANVHPGRGFDLYYIYTLQTFLHRTSYTFVAKMRANIYEQQNERAKACIQLIKTRQWSVRVCVCSMNI